jgi:cellulose synthase/poly-beta-1,6-N-acetylglucosamine synthase-like glycosyltransferase
LVQFVDGDCEVEDGWLECASTFLQDNPRVAAVCGRRRERHPEASFYNRICDEEWDTPVGRANSCGGDAMFRVRVLEQVGAYDGALIAGEEPELCSRLRKADWHIWRLDAPMTVHDAAMFFLRQWWLRAVRSGYGYAQVWHKTVRGSAEPVYTRELVRALWWTVGVTFSAGLAALAFGWAGILVAPALWGAQYLRLTRQQGMRKAGHLMLGKVAEFLGALRYAGAAMFRRERKGIFYK